MEKWKIVDEFPDYKVSSFGNIKNKYGKLLKQLLSSKGYPEVRFTINKIQHERVVHRLVAKAFISNPLGKCCVNHEDGIKTNNRVENLSWMTMSENEKHSFEKLGKIPTWKGKKGSKHPKSKEVEQYVNGVKVARFGSLVEAAYATGTTADTISTYIKKQKLLKGNLWKKV